ncbi:ParA family protein [Arundinibacter roseus]|uniref:ParA family protein n=1 Tax=Arundinibacter roseus TaxID=2070510 RepID=A0A4R4JZD1_9BACT|nr:ParA family protein [Arundinibacter roseus]TDB59522.1 ParA family protein [Arundinibacter roseus]
MKTQSLESSHEASAGQPTAPVVLAFATQKGGMGKTTLSVLVASWLHYKCGVKVAILDVDGSQLSVYNQRLSEHEHMDEETALRLDKQDIEPYAIHAGNPADVPALLANLAPDVQLVLIDMPGSIDVDGYETAIATLDHLIVPMETSRYAVSTGFSYLNAIRQIELLPIDRCKVVWNKYRPSRDGEIADQLEERFAQYGIKCLKSRIPQRDSYQDASNLSTLFPMPATYLRNSGLKDLFNEILELIPTIETHESKEE